MYNITAIVSADDEQFSYEHETDNSVDEATAILIACGLAATNSWVLDGDVELFCAVSCDGEIVMEFDIVME